MYIENYQ